MPRVLALDRFPAQQKNNRSAGADDQAQNQRMQTDVTQGMWRGRGALNSQEITKCFIYCPKPGKAPSPDKCPNELLKTVLDAEFLIVQAWVDKLLTLPEKTIDTARQSQSTMNGTISSLHN